MSESDASTAGQARSAYDGWRIGDTLEDPATCLGMALGHLETEAFSNPSSPVLAAAWCVLQAVQKLQAGEAFSLRTLQPFEPETTLAAEFEKAGRPFPRTQAEWDAPRELRWSSTDYGFSAPVDAHGNAYRIVATRDGLVSWQSPHGNGDWIHVRSVDEAKAACSSEQATKNGA